jgi:hypothetical protein
MTSATERAVRRHIREKATIDRLIKGVRKPSAPSTGKSVDQAQANEGATTSTGLSVEDQVRKQWTPSKGGLPIFWRDPPAFLVSPLPAVARMRGRS